MSVAFACDNKWIWTKIQYQISPVYHRVDQLMLGFLRISDLKSGDWRFIYNKTFQLVFFSRPHSGIDVIFLLLKQTHSKALSVRVLPIPVSKRRFLAMIYAHLHKCSVRFLCHCGKRHSFWSIVWAPFSEMRHICIFSGPTRYVIRIENYLKHRKLVFILKMSWRCILDFVEIIVKCER